MDAKALAAELTKLLSAETRSFARQLDELSPYLTAQTFKYRKLLGALVHDSADHAEALTDLIIDLDVPHTVPGTFPQELGNFHYVTLQRLLPPLMREKREQIAGYDTVIEEAGGFPQVQAALRELRASNIEHLEALEAAEKEVGSEAGATA